MLTEDEKINEEIGRRIELSNILLSVRGLQWNKKVPEEQSKRSSIPIHYRVIVTYQASTLRAQHLVVKISKFIKKKEGPRAFDRKTVNKFFKSPARRR